MSSQVAGLSQALSRFQHSADDAQARSLLLFQDTSILPSLYCSWVVDYSPLHRWVEIPKPYRQLLWIDFVFSFCADVVVHEDHTFILVVSLHKRYFLALLQTCRLFLTNLRKQITKDDLDRKSFVLFCISISICFQGTRA